MEKIRERKIVIINQAANYLTIGLCNAFAEKFEDVSLITGSVHVQEEELNPNVTITWINKFKERPTALKFFSYFVACICFYYLLQTKYRKHEVFFVSLPPMAYLLNLILSHRFSMVIWDVYPDVFKITGMSERNLLYRLWSHLNKLSFRKAYRLFTISEVMADSLSKYTDKSKIIIQPIWSIFQKNGKVSKEKNLFVLDNNLQDKFIVQYSGNIGLTHKVEVMVLLAEKMQHYPDILFQIIGRGSRVPILKRMVEERDLPNCQFLPFQADEMFPYSLSAADIGVVILDELTSKGSVPSKSYNLMSYGIPSLYIASEDSELHKYAEKFGHAKCFSERELDAASIYIKQIKEDEVLKFKFSQNANVASENFKRENASKFVAKYLVENTIS